MADPFHNADANGVDGITAAELEELAPMAMVVAGLALRKD
jgi:hypothetical protein